MEHSPVSIHSEMATSEATIDSIYHPKTGTWQYIVADPHALDAIVIDPVLDYDPIAQTISTETADGLRALVHAKGYRITRILETHVHADHLTAAAYLQDAFSRQQKLQPLVCIGKRIRAVQQSFASRYGVPDADLKKAFDYLLEDDETFPIGSMTAKVLHLPGHTPDHVGYIIQGRSSCCVFQNVG